MILGSRRNIIDLIRRTSTMELGHLMDSGQPLNKPSKSSESAVGEGIVEEGPPPSMPAPSAVPVMAPPGDPIQQQQDNKKLRQFDFSKWNRRHIALKLAYLGWDYHGMAIQDLSKPTVESCLFECLQKTRLIADSRSCRYVRCGRTDKGVSALGQVISLEVRSNLLEGYGVIVPEGSKAVSRQGDNTTELPYMVMLNNNLPSDMRVVSWAPVDPHFSARFSCLQRIYKYFFPLGEMNLDAMREAAQRFLGEHDFRNFCKMDISGGVTHFQRTIQSIDINPLDEGPPSPYQMCEMTVVGRAFLMHQVRCMVAILFLVGNGLEQPSIIDHMLDISRCPRKPQYGMAAPEPLILYDCTYEGLEWERDQRAYEKVVAHFQSMWTMKMAKTAMVRRMLNSLESGLQPTHLQLAPLMQNDHILSCKNYKPLLERPTSNTFEERYEHHKAKKRKLELGEEEGSSGAKSTHLSFTTATP